MKQRYLRPFIQRILEFLTLLSFGLLVSIDDFEICATSFLIIGTLLSILLVNGLLLTMYGREVEE